MESSLDLKPRLNTWATIVKVASSIFKKGKNQLEFIEDPRQHF